jgi:hypothetical protein
MSMWWLSPWFAGDQGTFIVQGPIKVAVGSQVGPPIKLVAWRDAAFGFDFELTANDLPLNLHGKTIKLSVFDIYDAAAFTAIEATVYGADFNFLNIVGPDSSTGHPGAYKFWMFNVTDDEVLFDGEFIINPGVKPS